MRHRDTTDAISRTAPLIHRAPESGTALVVILILVTVAGVIALSAIGVARTGQKIAFNDQLSKQALNIADAGVAHVMATLTDTYLTAPFLNDFDQELPSDGTAGALTSIGSVVDLDGAGIDYRFVNFGGPAASDGYYVRVIDNADEVPADDTDDLDKRIELISIGRIATAERELRATITGSAFHYGIFARDDVWIDEDAKTDSFRGSGGPYNPATAGSRGDVGSNDDIILSATGALIDGNGSASDTINLPGSITGNATPGAPPEFVASVPACSPYSSGAGVLNGVYNAVTGDLTDNGASLSLAGGTYCFGNITVAGGAEWTVTAPTVVFATGDVIIGGDGLNNTTQNALNLDLRVSGSNVLLQSTPTAYVRIYAPDAYVRLEGGSHVYGAVVGDDVRLDDFTEFHFDRDLVGPATFTLTGWHEHVGQ